MTYILVPTLVGLALTVLLPAARTRKGRVVALTAAGLAVVSMLVADAIGSSESTDCSSDGGDFCLSGFDVFMLLIGVPVCLFLWGAGAGALLTGIASLVRRSAGAASPRHDLAE